MIKIRKNILNKANNCQLQYSVRNYRSVENHIKICMSRGVAAVFQVSDSNPRERLGCDMFLLMLFSCLVVKIR
ncbi:MAG: hypothetical protein LBC68_01765 [Prevotellaceae bacterium]|jgi:hypothetical protein|nr:hypothetical protein [Prevotellaceae bacterium]